MQDASLCVHDSEFIGLIGPNGAGKTTLLKSMLGLIPINRGTIHKHVNRIGYVPQRNALYSGVVPMSVLEVVRLGGGTAEDAQRALRQVRLGHVTNRRFSELSGGQQQRVAIAKALAANADLLILDEPTAGIDERSQSEFYDMLRDLQQKKITIIMVSHEVEVVLKLVTRVICINRSILYDGPPEHFEADIYLPHVYTQQHRKLHHRHGDKTYA